MIVSVVAALLVLLIPGRGDSQSPAVRVSSPQHEGAKQEAKPLCTFALQKIREHRTRTWALQRSLGSRPPIRVSSARIVGCAYARWVEGLWWRRSVEWGKLAKARILPNTNDFQTAVRIAQRPFPGTEGWALDCSGAEGGHSAWVVYGGGPYYPGAEYAHTWWGDMVGGPFQYMWGTFKGHYRHALDSLRSRGFVVHLPPVDDVSAWRSMQAQALAGTWARWAGEDNSHWRASWDNGCR